MVARRDCDVLVIGGGLAGAALGISLARAGFEVVIAERERQFRDRIRGEILLPWGVAEAERLGLVDLLLGECAYEVPWMVDGEGGQAGEPEDTRLLGPHRTPSLSFLHPLMQETLLREAASLTTVYRGAKVGDLEPGEHPSATIEANGESRAVRARMVVGADGRDSTVARLARFVRRRDQPELLTAGVLVSGVRHPADQVHVHLDAACARMVIIVSPAPGVQRVYLIYRADSDERISGDRDFDEFRERVIAVGGPDAGWDGCWRQCGPLASFDGAHRWITDPARDGVVLVGDAAAASDPAWGCGLARTLRDVRLLRDALAGDDNWTRAADQYAHAHDSMFADLRAAERLVGAIWLRTGPEADATRSRVAAIPDTDADIGLYGPDMPREAAEACLSPASRADLANSYSLDGSP